MGPLQPRRFVRFQLGDLHGATAALQAFLSSPPHFDGWTMMTARYANSRPVEEYLAPAEAVHESYAHLRERTDPRFIASTERYSEAVVLSVESSRLELWRPANIE
jgi:hypothetical protein